MQQTPSSLLHSGIDSDCIKGPGLAPWDGAITPKKVHRVLLSDCAHPSSSARSAACLAAGQHSTTDLLSPPSPPTRCTYRARRLSEHGCSCSSSSDDVIISFHQGMHAWLERMEQDAFKHAIDRCSTLTRTVSEQQTGKECQPAPAQDNSSASKQLQSFVLSSKQQLGTELPCMRPAEVGCHCHSCSSHNSSSNSRSSSCAIIEEDGLPPPAFVILSVLPRNKTAC